MPWLSASASTAAAVTSGTMPSKTAACSPAACRGWPVKSKRGSPMTEFTPDALEALPGEMPRQHISRLRKYVSALLATLAVDDPVRTPLQAAMDDVDAILSDAAHRAAGRLQAALVARMQ